MGTKIILRESYSAGKTRQQDENGKDIGEKNDDDIYVGENFVAVIDGVSHKSSTVVNGKQIKIAQIITEAIGKIDRPDAPVYAKELSFEQTVEWINFYIKEYLKRHGMENKIGEMEATGVIYSKFHNQIWLVGDCRAVYDGNVVQNSLKIDKVYTDIRIKLMRALLDEGYTEEKLINNDISVEIIKNPELLSTYITSAELREELEAYRTQRIKEALLEYGFSEKEIEEQGLIKKYYNPRDLQKDLKNNPDGKSFGYAVFNGINTELRNCKVENLPSDVKTIKLFSDGFPIDVFKKNADVGYAVRTIRTRARKDPLSIEENVATHVSKRYSEKEDRRAIDDASVVVFEIARENEKEEEELEI